MNSTTTAGGMRIAIIDIGSASIRGVAVEVDASGSRRVLAEDRRMTKLGGKLATTGMLGRSAFEASLRAIVEFVCKAKDFGCTTVRAFATSAVREARNGDDFAASVAQVTARVGFEVQVEILSEDQEGLLALRSAASRVDIATLRVAVGDLGGGSLEIVLADRGRVWFNRSLPLGAVRLTEAFGGGEACAGPRFAEMERHVRESLASTVPEECGVDLLVASGGTLTSLAAMIKLARHAPTEKLPDDEWRARRVEVEQLLTRVRKLPVERRHEVPGLQRDRSEIIVAGFFVVRELMERIGVDSLLVNPAGLREGLLAKVIDEARTK